MKIYSFESVTSTQIEAKKILDLNNHNFAVIAKKQTRGYGRYGRRWISNEGGLYTSIVIDKIMLPQIKACVWVLEAIKKLYGVVLEFKWPNDITLKSKKIGGILVEEYRNKHIIGIGVNMNNEVDRIFGNLYEFTGKNIDCMSMLEEIIKEMDSKKNCIEIYKKHCSTIGKYVEVETGEGLVRGIAVDVNMEGCLIVDGSIIKEGSIIKCLNL